MTGLQFIQAGRERERATFSEGNRKTELRPAESCQLLTVMGLSSTEP